MAEWAGLGPAEWAGLGLKTTTTVALATPVEGPAVDPAAEVIPVAMMEKPLPDLAFRMKINKEREGV